MARVVIIGYGLAGSVFHGPLVSATDGLEVAAVVTSDTGRQARARADHPGAAVLSSADEIWAGPGSYDLVVVATANVAHVPLATAALDAGLPVVVDKPLAVTAADARALAEHARTVGGRLGVFFNRRWDDDLLTVRRLLADGVLGDVLRFESRFERWRPEPRAGSWRESAAPEDGGGLLLDLGTHLVDQAVLLFGPPRSVYAEVGVRRPGADVDDDVFVALEHAPHGSGGSGPVRSHLWMSSVAADAGPRLRVRGTRAAFAVDGLDGQEDALRAGGRSPATRRPPGRLSDGSGSRPVPLEPGGWADYYALVATAVASGAPLPVDAASAVGVAEVLDAARVSARESRVVTL